MLGPHGDIVRTFQPGARAVTVLARSDGREIARLEQAHPAGIFAGRVPDARALPAAHRVAGRRGAGNGGPLLLRPAARPGGHPPAGRGTAFRDRPRARRAAHDGGRRRRRALRPLGAERAPRLGDRRLQRLGRPPPPDAAARARRACGSCSSRGSASARSTSTSCCGPDWSRAAAEGRPGRAADRDAARHRLARRLRRALRLDRRGLDGGPRRARRTPDAPISIYEVHPGSWWHKADGTPPDWDLLGDRLIPYVRGMGFTHLEFLPVMEHPFGGSWGYQPLGQFAPSARYGTPAGFARFVDRAHAAGHRRDPRLGAGALPDRRARPVPLRRHGALRARRPARGLPSRLEQRDLQFRPQRGARLPARQRAALAGALPRRRAARGRGGVHALPRLLPQGRRVDPEPLRRAREPGGGAVPAGAERGRAGALPGRGGDRRGEHRLARRDAADAARAGSASSSSGTWGGCTTRSTTWQRTRSTAATTTTR